MKLAKSGLPIKPWPISRLELLVCSSQFYCATFRQLRGLDTLSTALLVVLCAICGYVVSLLGSYLINYIWVVPAELHREQRAEIQRRDENILSLENALAKTAKLPPHEVRKESHVKMLIENATSQEMEVLASLANCDELYYEQVYAQHPREAVDSSVAKWQYKLIAVRIEAGTQRTFWSIVPGMKDALIRVLY